MAVMTALALALFSPMADAAVAAPQAVTGAVTSVLPTSAVVSGVVNPHGATTKWFFEYGPSTSYGSTTPVNSAGAGTSDVTVSASLPGLSPATSYHYRLVASNSGGSDHGLDGNFSTSQVPTAETTAASQLTASSATLNGVVNPEGQATTWYFQYGSSTSYGSKTAAKVLAAGPNPVNVTSALTSLAPETTYHARLVATSGAGETRGVDVSFTTGLPVTLNSASSSVVYGAVVTVSGVVASGRTGDHVTLESERFDQTTFVGVAAMVTGPGGTWTYSVQPTARTTYKAIANGGTSSPVTVSVSPAVSLSTLSGARFSTRVVGSVSFAAHVARLQVLSHGRWIAVKLLHLNGSSKSVFAASLLPVGKSTFRVAIGSTIVGIDQAAPGYLTGYSRSLVYHRG
jgi:hypothetical protein